MNPNDPNLHKRSAAWSIRFVILGVVNLITVIVPIAILAWLSGLARSGVSGTEFIGLLIAPLVLAGYATLVLNVVLFAIYLLRRRPRRVRRVLVIVGLVLSAAGIVYGIVTNVVSTVRYSQASSELSLADASTLINECHVRAIDRQRDNGTLSGDPNKTELILFIAEKYYKDDDPYSYQKYARDSDFDSLKAVAEKASARCGKIDVGDLPENYHMQEISVDQATELLKTCKLVGFYYTAQNDGETDAESSSTGVLLAYEGSPIRIHIADRLIPTLVPIARDAQKTCPDLQFWHDDRYEQRDENGNWE